MSEKESTFIKNLKWLIGSLILAIILESFSFYVVTQRAEAAQQVINKNFELGIRSNEEKIETKVGRDELNLVLGILQDIKENQVRFEMKLDHHISPK